MRKEWVHLVATCCILVLIAFCTWLLFYRQQMRGPNIVNKAKNQNTSTEVEKIEPTITHESNTVFEIKDERRIDTVEDSKALGYTGQKKIATDSKGNIYITYRKKYEGNYEIFVTKMSLTDSGDHSISGTKVPISVIGKDATQRVSSIAISQNDVISVTWYGLDPDDKIPGRQVKYSQSTDYGKTWTKWKNIAVVAGYSDEDYWQEHPQVAVYNKSIYIVWEGKDTSNDQQQIKFTKSTDGGITFSTWKNVRPTQENTQSRPSIIVDGKGWLHLFMYSSQSTDNDSQQIWHSVSIDNGDTWSIWENISRSKLDARHVSAIFDDPKIIAVWRQQIEEEAQSQVVYSVYNDTKWSEPKIINGSTDYQMFPTLGKDGEGVYAAWVETPESSGFPRDNPAGAQGYVSYLQKTANEFGKPLALSLKQDILYPHITENASDSAYLVYEKEFGDTYGIFISILTTR